MNEPEAEGGAIEPAGDRLGLVVLFVALAGAAIGLIGLAGWVVELPHLKSVLADAVEMKANTAVALVAAGLSLALIAARSPQAFAHGARVLAALVVAIGVATLSESLLGWQLGIDELLFDDNASTYSAIRGRMSPYAAVALSALGASLLLVGSRRFFIAALSAAAVPLVIGVVFAVGYAWEAPELITDALLPPVALNTAIAFILLAGGALMAILQGGGPDGRGLPFAMTSIEGRILTGFAASFLLLAVGGGLSYKTGADFAESAASIAHTQQVRATLGQLHGDLSGAGWRQRNYLLTGDPEHLLQYRQLVSRADGHLAELLFLVVDWEQALALAALQPLAQQLHQSLDQGILAYQDGGMPEAQRMLAVDTSTRAMSQLQGVIRRMMRTENELLVRRRAAGGRMHDYMLASLLLTLGMAACLFGFLFRGIRRQMHARQEAEQRHDRARHAAIVARQEADLANRAKSTFLAAMSHEIRTPMNGVLGLLELLSLGRLDAEQRSTLTVASESGRSLLRIVDDILDFSKMEADRMELNPRPASVSELAARMRDIHGRTAASRGLALRVTVDPRISPCLHFDAQRVEQILNNFIGNALKFTQAGSVDIDISLQSATASADLLCFSVKDTGIGVSADNLERLFQPFMQAESDTVDRFGGTGLGLVICRRLARLMDGTVAMRSEPGVGTEITLSAGFPRGTPGELEAARERAALTGLDTVMAGRRKAVSVAQAEAEGTLVLVVDDHPTNRMVLRRQLNSLGYTAQVAADGQLALQAWKTGRFGAIIADCNMPVMTGYEMARAIRAEEASAGSRRIPILACTANALDSEAALCIEAGMDDCLVKPVSLQLLAVRLERWLPLPVHQPSSPLDPQQLAAASFGDAAMQAEILADFRRITDEDAVQLRAAVAAGSLSEVIHFAHRIAGACAMVGATALAEACRSMERAGRDGDLPQVSACLPTFELEMLRLEAFLTAPAPETRMENLAQDRTPAVHAR